MLYCTYLNILYCQAPPEGWKCDCIYKGAWTCSGVAMQCDHDETCPGDCYSRECCQHGGGDCGGYRVHHFRWWNITIKQEYSYIVRE